MQPSRAISDQYRNLVVGTDEDERVDGGSSSRSFVADAAPSDGASAGSSARTRVVAPFGRLADAGGLIANVTLEDVKDLFAYLRAEVASRRRRGDVRLARRALGDEAPGGPTTRPRGARATRADGKGEKLEHSRYLLFAEVVSDFEIEFDVRMTKGNSGSSTARAPSRGRRTPSASRPTSGRATGARSTRATAAGSSRRRTRSCGCRCSTAKDGTTSSCTSKATGR